MKNCCDFLLVGYKNKNKNENCIVAAFQRDDRICRICSTSDFEVDKYIQQKKNGSQSQLYI